MKTDGSESCSKSTTNDNEQNELMKKDEAKDSKSSNDGSALKNDTKEDPKDTLDPIFEPSVEMLVNDFDEENTLDEEEALAATEQIDPGQELSDLQRESELPLEELLKLYGYGSGPPVVSSSSARKRRRRRDRTSPKESEKVEKDDQQPIEEPETETVQSTQEEIQENSGDEDAATTTETNNIENQSVDDETNYEEEEPSELKKLYTKIYEKDGEVKLDATLSDEDEDLDYCPEEEEGKKTIMVGSDYQAVIPEGLFKYDDVLPYENEDKLLWDPSKVNEDLIEDYLNKFSTPTNGSVSHSVGTTQTGSSQKHLRDDEQALLLLVQCGNNCEEALRRRRLNTAQQTNTMSIWSEEECRNFENGLKMYGKSFHEIQASKVTTRSVGELVEFYYLWKKTERADQFAAKSRLEKKKYNLNPCVTDMMEKYLEEYDTNNRERDRSVSPNVNSNSLLLTDTKRHPRMEQTTTASNIAGSGNNNQVSQEKLIKQKLIDESTAIKTE